MRFRYLITLLLVSAVSRVMAEEPRAFNPADYPGEVQTALRYADEECTAQGGGVVTFAPDTVRKLDLTGDGRDGYVVDFRDTKCENREAVYCGTGGCVMDILVTLPDGRVRGVFDGYVRNYELRPMSIKRGAPRVVRFELHGGYCGGHGSPSCYKDKAITATPFEFKIPQ